jgi:hypothetical protein
MIKHNKKLNFSLFIFIIFSITAICFDNSKSYAQTEPQTIEAIEYEGNVEYKTAEEWLPLKEKGTDISGELMLKTNEDSTAKLQMPFDNLIKMYPSTIAKSTNSNFNLIHGEISTAISLSGRARLEIRVSNVKIIGQSGLFKVLYNQERDLGEVIVKNGLIEVYNTNENSKPIKLSGFYKISFEKGNIQKPTQASVIQYDWR